MNSGKKIPVAWYAVIDYFTAALAWLCFYFVRSSLLQDKGAYPISYQSWFYILAICSCRLADTLYTCRHVSFTL